MPFSTVATPRHRAMMAGLIDGYCDANGFDETSIERADAVYFLALLFENGVQSPERLKLALSVRHRLRRQRRSESAGISVQIAPAPTDRTDAVKMASAQTAS